MKKIKYQIFISYRSDTGKQMAEYIYEAFSRQGYTVFFDRESLQSGAFDEAIYEAIDGCEVFLLIMSSGTLDVRIYDENDWIKKEIVRALDKNKKIIPILLGDFYDFPENLPASIDRVRKMNGIDFRREEFPLARLEDFFDFKPSAIIRWINNFQNIWRESSMNKMMRGGLNAICFMLFCHCVYVAIHYTYKDTWDIPKLLRPAFRALVEAPIDRLSFLVLLSFVAIMLFWQYIMKGSLYYMKRKYGERDLNELDVESAPLHILSKIGYEFPARYKKNEYMEQSAQGMIQKKSIYYKKMNGLEITSVGGRRVDYLRVNYHAWPKLTFLLVGRYTDRKNAIRLLSAQGYHCYEIKDEVLSFVKDGLYVRLFYKKYRIDWVVVSRYPVFVYLNAEDGTQHEFVFLDWVEWDDKIYWVLLPQEEIEKGEVLIIEDRNEQYAVPDDFTVSVIYGVFKEKNKDRFDFTDSC